LMWCGEVVVGMYDGTCVHGGEPEAEVGLANESK
jgi:hypothetical protein